MHLAAARLHEMEKSKIQELENVLMSVRRHRECFQKAIGKFNQSASMVGEYEVFFLAPCSLTWEDFFKKISPFLGINFGERFRYRGHRRVASEIAMINFPFTIMRTISFCYLEPGNLSPAWLRSGGSCKLKKFSWAGDSESPAPGWIRPHNRCRR